MSLATNHFATKLSHLTSTIATLRFEDGTTWDGLPEVNVT